MLVVPASNLPINGGTAIAGVCYSLGPLVTGESVSVAYMSAVADAGVTRPDFGIYMYGSVSLTPLHFGTPLYATTNFTDTQLIPSDEDWTLCINGGGAPPDSSHGRIFNFSVDVTVSGLPFCQYGVEKRGGSSEVLLITLDLVVTLAGIFVSPWLLVFLLPAVGLHTEVEMLCRSQAPVAPALKPLTQWSPGDAKNWIEAAMWNQWCMCSPATGGGSAPIPPPQPVPIPPNQVGLPPTSSPTLCDDTTLCNLLNILSLQVGSLQQQVAILNPLVTLIQRQGVPFGYLVSTAHTGLSGSGQFAVQGILGLSVEVTTLPPDTGHTTAHPSNFFDVGELSLGTAEGWTRRIAITKETQLELDISGAVTLVGYYLNVGVVATIRELVREF